MPAIKGTSVFIDEVYKEISYSVSFSRKLRTGTHSRLLLDVVAENMVLWS